MKATTRPFARDIAVGRAKPATRRKRRRKDHYRRSCQTGEKKRSFTDEEGRTILRAALGEKDLVRRWIPWISAYSGARVSEICELRREDIVEIEGVWCMKIYGGGICKDKWFRTRYPASSSARCERFPRIRPGETCGPIFAGLTPDKFGKRGGNGTKIIGRFVRQLGIVDPRISPSHSWRHRIKTLGRCHGLAQDILEAITGHGSRSVADAYGEFPIEVLHRELSRFPRLSCDFYGPSMPEQTEDDRHRIAGSFAEN